jgi:WD40 repeat protein
MRRTLTSDGRRVVSVGADDTLRIWDPLSGAELAVLPVDAGETTASALGAADTLLLTGHRSGSLCTWRITDGGHGETFGHGAAAVLTCALSRDGEVALAGRADGSVELIELRSGDATLTRSGHQGAVRACLLSPDGQVAVTAGEDGFLRWHGRGGELLAEHHEQPDGCSPSLPHQDGTSWRPAGSTGRCACTTRGAASFRATQATTD